MYGVMQKADKQHFLCFRKFIDKVFLTNNDKTCHLLLVILHVISITGA